MTTEEQQAGGWPAAQRELSPLWRALSHIDAMRTRGDRPLELAALRALDAAVREHLAQWTVIGAWYKNEPFTLGVVAGDNRVYGGSVDDLDELEDLQGGWTLVIRAEDPEAAEAAAIAQILHEQEFDEAPADADAVPEPAWKLPISP
jgi:hypothetical protein